MVAEVLAALKPKPGGRYADGTVGGAGHAAAILKASAPSGWLFGCDRDDAALELAALRLAEFAGRFELRRGNFAELSDWFEAGSGDGVLLDLGVSSPQLDRAERGFSFQRTGPLDMRMDQSSGETAAELVARLDERELASILRDLGEERFAGRIARRIVEARGRAPLDTTGALAEVVAHAVPG